MKQIVLALKSTEKDSIYTHTTTQKFGVGKVLTEDCFAHQSCIYLIKNTEKSLILSNIITI